MVVNQTDTVSIVARIPSISIIIASKVEPVVSYIFALNPVKPIKNPKSAIIYIMLTIIISSFIVIIFLFTMKDKIFKSFGFHKHICQVKKDASN